MSGKSTFRVLQLAGSSTLIVLRTNSLRLNNGFRAEILTMSPKSVSRQQDSFNDRVESRLHAHKAKRNRYRMVYQNQSSSTLFVFERKADNGPLGKAIRPGREVTFFGSQSITITTYTKTLQLFALIHNIQKKSITVEILNFYY